MENNKLIEEIEIIIRAKVEEARKDIKKVAQSTKEMVNSVTKDLNKMESDGNLDKFKEEIKSVKEEFRQVKMFVDGVEFEFNPKISGDINKQYQKAIDNLPQPKIETATNNGDNEFSTITPNIDISSTNEQLKSAQEEVYALEERLNDFNALTIKEEIKTIGMQIMELIPQVKSFKNELTRTLNDNSTLLGMFKNKIYGLADKFNEVKEKISNSFNSIQISGNRSIDSIKVKIQPLISILKNVGIVGKNAFVQMQGNVKDFSSKFSKPITAIKNLINKIKSVKTETEKTKKQTSNFGTDIGKSISKGMGSIKKFALSLLSVRTAFSMISRAAQSYLSFDEQLNNSLQNSWNVLGSLLAPTLEFVASLFNKLVSVVATFVKLLTGIDLVAKANAKALNSQAKATKNVASANHQLSSIDDIDTLSSNSGSDSNSGDSFAPITTQAVDLGPLELAFEKIKEILSQLFNPFKQAWDNVGEQVITSMKNAFNSIWELIKSIGSSLLEVWTNGTGQTLIENMLLGWQQIFDIIGGVAEALTNAWNNAGVGTAIIQNIADIFQIIQQYILLFGDSLKQLVISPAFQKALDLVFQVIKDITSWLKELMVWTLSLYETYVKPVIDEKLLPALESIADMFTAIWEVAKPVIDKIIDNVKKYLEPIIAGLGKTLGSIIDIIKGIADFVTGVFTGNWKKAWNGIKDIIIGVFNTIKNAISTIWNAIWGVIKGVINWIISGAEKMCNSVIKGLNKIIKPLADIGNKVLKAIGITGFNFNIIPNISLPRLAKGTVAYEPMYAEIGEYTNAKNNPEIVSPVNMMKESFRDVLNEYETGGTRLDKLIINIAGENFFDEVIEYINSKSARKGVSVIKEV